MCSLQLKEVGILHFTRYWEPNSPALFLILSTADEIGDILFLFYLCHAILCCIVSELKAF